MFISQKPEVYFYRDHYGNEVDFVIPGGEKVSLYEYKWSENPSLDVKAFHVISNLIGEEKITLKSIITPVRGSRTIQGITVEDCVDFHGISV
jgi:predicted AAA+ superfamily ATPase